MKGDKSALTFDDLTHRYGRIWMVSILVILLMVPVAFMVRYGVYPRVGDLDIGQLIPVFVMFYGTAIIETASYSPLLGTTGMYLSFVSGEISNLRLPCALAAMNKTDVRSGSDEAEVISAIAIAVSTIVSTAILAVFVLLLRPVLPSLTAEGALLAPAFKQVLPCLFGALGASYFIKYWKLGIAPLAVLVIVLLFSGKIPTGTLIPIGVIVSLATAQLLYKKNKI